MASVFTVVRVPFELFCCILHLNVFVSFLGGGQGSSITENVKKSLRGVRLHHLNMAVMLDSDWPRHHQCASII